MVHVHAFQELERKVGFKQGKGGKWKTCLTIKEDVPEKKIEKYMVSTEVCPNLILFTSDDKLELIAVIGDETVLHVNEQNFVYGLVVLVCCYYVYDLAFPRKYCQSLGFIQHLILKDPYLDKKTDGFLNLLSKVEGMGKPVQRKERERQVGKKIKCC